MRRIAGGCQQRRGQRRHLGAHAGVVADVLVFCKRLLRRRPIPHPRPEKGRRRSATTACSPTTSSAPSTSPAPKPYGQGSPDQRPPLTQQKRGPETRSL